MAIPPHGLRREDFQIAIICAISCEYDAVIFAFDEIWDGADLQLGNAPGDFNKYTIGRIANRNAVLLLLPGMGKVNAASAASSLRSSYTGIKLAILAGICGGVPGVGTQKELLLGDVVISRSIVQYDLGRRYADRFSTKDTIEDTLGRPHESVRSLTAVLETNSGRDRLQHRTSRILESIQEKSSCKGNVYQRPAPMEDRLFEPGYLHRHHGSRQCKCNDLGACDVALQASCEELQCDSSRLMSRSRLKKRKAQNLECDELTVHELRITVGRLGSGDTVMKSGLDRDRIAGDQDLVAFEMEGAGIWDRFPCIVVKAICDYADSHKNKKYQVFAAARAASATKAILEAFPGTDGPPRASPMHVQRFDLVSRDAGSNIQKAPQRTREHDENDRRLLQLLAADHEAQKNFNPKRVPGTCEWFLRDQRYLKWLESTTSSIIWISAGPGCGKSVLARTLIDEGRLSVNYTNTTVCYFFFKDGDEHRINSYDALSSILHQLFSKDQTESLIANADHAHKNYGARLRRNFHQLWEILVACANQPGSREIVCVLDALDECCKEGRKDIFQMLELFYFGEQSRSISSRLKFLITSRPYDDLEMSFERMVTAESYIRLDGDDKSEEICHEIDLVIDHKVKEFGKDFREEHRSAISERLKAMENRTYLWLHLTLGIIDEKRSAYRKPSSVQTLLSHLPSSVFDAYEKILSRSQDEQQARCLLNIILGATRPLTLDEVNWAYSLQTKDFMNRNEIEDDIWPRQILKITVKNLCGLFVSVVDNKIFLIHQTARDFLTSNSGLSSTWKGSFDMSFAHGIIFISCMRLLSLHDTDFMVHSAFHGQGPPFMEYAVHNWVLHYNSQGSEEGDEFCGAARELCRTVSGRPPRWTWYSQSCGGEFGHALDCTDLKLACYLGLLNVVDHMLDIENVDVDSDEPSFGSATEAAARKGHLPVVQSLIRHGSTWEAEGHGLDCSLALEAAIREGHMEVAKYLLVERGDPITDEVAIAAVGYGDDEQTIAFLVEKYRDEIDITEEVICSAIENESGGGDIVTFLLDTYGEEIHVTQALLETAAGNWRHGYTIITLLLERCEDDFHISGRVSEIAAGNPACGHKIIALFLERYGDQFNVTPTVVEQAVCDIRTISLLLDQRGYQVDITPGVVIRAARDIKSGAEVMRLLLDKRRDEVVITQDVFIAAAMNMHIELMVFLLDEYGAEVEITQKVISAAESHEGGDLGLRMMNLLRQKRPNEVGLSHTY